MISTHQLLMACLMRIGVAKQTLPYYCAMVDNAPTEEHRKEAKMRLDRDLENLFDLMIIRDSCLGICSPN